MPTATIDVLPSPGVLVAQAPLTDDLGNEVGAGSQVADHAQRLTHQILAAIDHFRAGKLSWRELQSLRQRAQELLPRVPEETAADGLRRAVARIDAQGRTAGDDTGWDVVEVLKSHRDQALSMAQRNQGDITHGELRRARDWARQVMTARQGHWEAGARVNAGQLLRDIETKYLPALENLEVRQISALEQARRSFVQAPTPEGRQLLQQWRDLMNARFNANEFAPGNGRVLKQVLAAANEALQSRAGRQHAPPSVKVSGGDPLPKVKPRVVDIDPDGNGPLKATYVGVDKGSYRLQTRVVAVQQHDGSQWVTTGYEARGVTVTDLRTNRIVSERPGRKYTLEDVRSPEQAVNRAREMLQHGAISTGSETSQKSRSVLDGTNDGRFETPSLIVPRGLGGLGNRWLAGFREVLEAQVGADAQRYLKAGNALIGLRGTDLPNYVGVAMDLAPNVVPVQGAGNQLLYKGEALQAIDTVTQAIRAAGGDAPQVRAVPVYLRVADDQMAKTTIFRVQGRDGRERIVDNVGRTYESLEKWKQNNQLGAVDVFLPQGGRLQGRDGRVVLEAFNNRRFGNTVLPVLRGGVAILGAGAGVAAILGSGGVAVPLVMVGGAVFSVADSGATLADRARHGQTLALTNQQARAAWLDFGAGLLGAFAIGTGSKVLARASDLADVLTLGNGARDLASDWNKLGVGERVLAGAQLAFWGAMLGASQFSGGRFNLDPLWARAPGGDGRAPGGSGTNEGGSPQSTRSAGEPPGNRKPRPGERPYQPTKRPEPPVRPVGPRPQPTPAQQLQQQVQDLIGRRSRELFGTAEFRQRFEREIGRVGGNPAARAELLADPVRVQALGHEVALDAVMERTFGGSGVPDAVRQAFQGRAEAWAQQQVRVQGGTAAGWLEALAMHPNASGHRAELLRPVVAEHLGGGNERLKNALEVQLRPLGESALMYLVAPGRDGQPQQAAVDTLRRALVARWAEDYRLSAQDQARLGQEIDQRLQGKTLEQQRAELVNLAGSNQTRNSLVGQARGNSKPVAPVNEQVGQGVQAGKDALPKVGGVPRDVVARIDQGVAGVQQVFPDPVFANPVVNGLGDTYNKLAGLYRGALRGLQNNPIVLNTLDRYQAAVRQARYFPQHFAAKVAVDQRLAAADRAVTLYQQADARLGQAQDSVGRLAAQLQTQIDLHDAASARGDTAAQAQALAQSRRILSELDVAVAQGSEPLRELRVRVEGQLRAGQALLEKQKSLLGQRQSEYDTALQQAQGVDTPRVLQARQALAEARQPFELEKTVQTRRQAYDALLAASDADPGALEDARRAYEQAKTALARHSLAGRDAAIDAWIDRDQGLTGQLQTLEVLVGRLRQLEGSMGQRVEPGAGTDVLARAVDALQQGRELVQRGVDHARVKRQALEGAQLVVDQQARIDQLSVDARASQSELSGLLGRIGFAHSQAKDIYDGKGKGRIDGLSNRAKIERAAQDVEQFRAELSQWDTRLATLDGEIASLQADRAVTDELKAAQLEGLQRQRADAQTQQGRAQGRLDAATRRLQLEQRAAEPRSIKVRVDDLQAKIDTSQKLLGDMRVQHGQKQASLQAKVQALQAELQSATDPSRRQQLQGQLDALNTKIDDNDYALARAELIHSHTTKLLEGANQALDQARGTGAVTPGKAARNVVRGGIVAAAAARALTLAELATGSKQPDKPEDLLPLLKQMNLPGSEKPLKVEDFKPVGGVPGLYEVATVQGPVYVWRTRGTFSDLVVVAQPKPQARGVLLAPLFNGGTAGRASPSIQKGTDGIYLTLDSQRITLASVTFASVFHPDPTSTALNWWETVRIEVGAYGFSSRFNTASTNPQTGAKVPMAEFVNSNSIKAPVPTKVKLPGQVPLIGDTLELAPGVGVAVTVKNSLGVGQLSLVWDPEMGVGQQSDRTSSIAFKFDGKQGVSEWNPGTQPYGFFGTAIRLEKNYWAKYDPRNDGHWLMTVTKPLEQAFDAATFKWAANPLSELLQRGIDGMRDLVSRSPDVPAPVRDLFSRSPRLGQSVGEAYIGAAQRWAEEKVQTEGGTVSGHLQALALFGGATRADLLRPLVAKELGGNVPVLVNALHAELAGSGEEGLLSLVSLSQAQVDLVRDVLVDVWARDFGFTAAERENLRALVQEQMQGKTLVQQRALLQQLAEAPEARRALVERANETPVSPGAPPGLQPLDRRSALPPGAAYARGMPLVELAVAGLATPMPGLDVNPTGSARNCLNAAFALDRQLAGAPAVATALEISDPDDLFDLYGRLPEQGFGARGSDGSFLLGPGQRFGLQTLLEHVASLPEGARGIVLVSYGEYGQGHALVVRNVGGRAVLLDGQSGAVVDPRALSTGAIALPDALRAFTRGSPPAERADVSYLFLRTDDVPGLSPLAPGVRQAIAIHYDETARRVEIVDPRTGESRWIDVSLADFDALAARPGLNVYVWQTSTPDGRAQQHLSGRPPWASRSSQP